MCKKQEQLESLMELCRNLGADVEYRPEYGHFTAMIWEDQSPPCELERARSIQKQIQKKAAQYPNVVCYCFDPFSTLVYTV